MASARYESLITRARAGEPILIDGATGSETMRRGVHGHEHGWSGGASLTHPEVVRSIHDDYLALGADLVVANTFATGRNIMRDVGGDADFEIVNRRAVEIVVQARDASGSPTVAGAGISNWSFSGNRPSLDELHADTTRQAEVMRDAGAELLSLEMMVDMPRFEVTLDAASSVGLPVWVGFSVGEEPGHDVAELDDPIQLREGGSLVGAVEHAAANRAVDAVCIMHTDVRLVESCLHEIGLVWDGPLGAYAHASKLVEGDIVHDDVLTPEQYVAYVPSWKAAGATMIGGCCGIGPSHLEMVAAELR